MDFALKRLDRHELHGACLVIRPIGNAALASTSGPTMTAQHEDLSDRVINGGYKRIYIPS